MYVRGSIWTCRRNLMMAIAADERPMEFENHAAEAESK